MIKIGQETIVAVLGLFLIITGFVTIILLYHWNKFGLADKSLKKTRFLYLFVLSILVAVSLISFLTIY